jgi:hypothetical protein
MDFGLDLNKSFKSSYSFDFDDSFFLCSLCFQSELEWVILDSKADSTVSKNLIG